LLLGHNDNGFPSPAKTKRKMTKRKKRKNIYDRVSTGNNNSNNDLSTARGSSALLSKQREHSGTGGAEAEARFVVFPHVRQPRTPPQIRKNSEIFGNSEVGETWDLGLGRVGRDLVNTAQNCTAESAAMSRLDSRPPELCTRTCRNCR